MTAFWMTWKPEGWPLAELRRLVDTFNRDGVAEEPWRIIAHKRAKAGDRVFFKQGKEPRGIFGVGTIVGEASLRPELSTDPEKPQHFVPVRFTELVDPTSRLLLPLENFVDVVPDRLIRAQASGYPMPPEVAVRVAERLGLPVGEQPEQDLRNPPWNRDELILALDAYVRWNGSPPANTPEIEELSQTLNKLRRVLGTRGQSTLRNTNGVYMKLTNFRRLDPAFASRGIVGLSRGNRLEKEVWDEFRGDPIRLRKVAEAIRTTLRDMNADALQLPADAERDFPDEEEASEGRLLTVEHHRRERSRKLVLAKKAASMKANGKLTLGRHDPGIRGAYAFTIAARLGDRVSNRELGWSPGARLAGPLPTCAIAVDHLTGLAWG